MQSQMQSMTSNLEFSQQSNFCYLSSNSLLSHRKSVLKRKRKTKSKLLLCIPLKYIINIHDICFVNEFSLRNPKQSEQTVFRTLSHYKTISKVTVNKCFVNLHLKKNYDNFIPPEYFFERLRSFGDKQLANIANYLESINLEFSAIKNTSEAKEDKQKYMSRLAGYEKYIEQFKDRKIFIYISSIDSRTISLKNVLFSIPLLKYLGIEVQSMVKDFIKNKMISFQVFSAKNYANFLQNCFQRFSDLQKKMRINSNVSKQENRQIFSFQSTQQIIRRKHGLQSSQQELIKVKIRWFSPHPQLCCIQILQKEQEKYLQFEPYNHKDIQIQYINQQLDKLKISDLKEPSSKIQ